MKNKSLNIIIFVLCIVLVIAVILYIQNDKTYGYKEETTTTSVTTTSTTTSVSINKSEIPDYSGNAVIEINSNKPEFSDSDYNTESFEIYSSLDSLGRCGVAYANIGVDLMPTEKRGSISNVKPSGWQSVKYDNVPGKNNNKPTKIIPSNILIIASINNFISILNSFFNKFFYTINIVIWFY